MGGTYLEVHWPTCSFCGSNCGPGRANGWPGSPTASGSLPGPRPPLDCCQGSLYGGLGLRSLSPTLLKSRMEMSRLGGGRGGLVMA